MYFFPTSAVLSNVARAIKRLRIFAFGALNLTIARFAAAYKNCVTSRLTFAPSSSLAGRVAGGGPPPPPPRRGRGSLYGGLVGVGRGVCGGGG
ncbi:MAG: hypothetical protein LBP89_06640, partial [Helicobacteraceae bacterium]|nr:hypothetical protein [Helicobacteraceae bacterium]